MSPLFLSIKNWYDNGLWDADAVNLAAANGWITAQEAAAILA